MKRITFEEFEAKFMAAEKVSLRERAVDNETRCGSYYTLQTGLSFATYFVGMAKDEGKFVIEDVT